MISELFCMSSAAVGGEGQAAPIGCSISDITWAVRVTEVLLSGIVRNCCI